MDCSDERHPGVSEQREVLIAFVDLVQFTALTDIHGDLVAADAATAMSTMAMGLGGGNMRVVKSIGDGVLLEAATCADGLAAVVGLMEGIHEHGFEARAGADWGPIVRRGTDVFGRTVNLASRLADVARPGKVAMTRDVALEASGSGLTVAPLGLVGIRGFRDPIEVFAADPCAHDGRWFTDPVCGMRVDPAGALTLPSSDGVEFGFCSQRCADIFAAKPDQNDCG